MIGTRQDSPESREAREDAGRLRPRVFQGALALAGVAVSALLGVALRRGEHEAARGEFQLDAVRLTSAARQSLEGHIEQVRATAALFISSKLVEEDEFQRFTASSLARYPALRALLWLEQGAGAPEEQGLGEGPEAGPASSVPELEQRLAPSLARCAQRGELTLTPPLRGETVRVAALEPVEGREAGRGVVAGLLDVERMLAGASRPPGPTGLVLDATDVQAGARLTDAPALEEFDARHDLELPVGGRTWTLTCYAPAGFLAAHETWLPWIAFGLGLLATGLVVVTLDSAGARLRAQRIARGRAEEVLKAYATLSHEAKERMWAESERHQLEQQLRAVIDLVPDQIYVKDALGRYLLANTATAVAHGTTVERLTATSNVDPNEAPLPPDGPLTEEQLALRDRRATILPTQPFVDARGRRRILRQTMLPCDAFGKRLRAMLVVASDVTELKQAENVLRAQNRLLSELARGEDPERVLAQIVHATEELVPGMRCSVLLLAPDGRHLRHAFAPSLPDDYNAAIDGLEIGPEVGSCGAAAALGERVVVADVMEHPNWAPYRDMARRTGFRACWSQPIRATDGAILGTFAMYYSEPRSPEPFEERFIEAMAHMAGIAIERARSTASS